MHAETWREYAELTDKPIRRCSECNRYHIRSKMNTGERSFCEKCRTPTIKSKHAMRDWRKRRA